MKLTPQFMPDVQSPMMQNNHFIWKKKENSLRKKKSPLLDAKKKQNNKPKKKSFFLVNAKLKLEPETMAAEKSGTNSQYSHKRSYP